MPNLPNEDREKRVVATGPNQGFSVRGVTGFFTDADKLDYGVNVQGNRCGVFGKSVPRPGDTSGREADVEGVGVFGTGENFGVFGKGHLGLSGIVGVHNNIHRPNRDGTGVIGAVIRGGTGVIGVSLNSLTPLIGQKEIPDAGDGDGVGVFGASGSGPGVRGSSDEGPGGEFVSNAGIGVSGESGSGTAVEGNSNSGAGVVGRCTHGVGGFFNSVDKEALVGVSGGPGNGVRGFAPGSGTGVKGESINGIGVFGDSAGIGVFGDSAEQSGVVGVSRGKTAPGVFGFCEKLTGVAGRSTEAPGVFGDSAKQAGVMGVSRGTFDTSAPGVFGFGIAPFRVPGPPAGVLGLNDNSVGVLGSSERVIGVLGNTDKGLAVAGTANFGAGVPTDQITDQGIGVIGLANSGVGVAGLSTSGTGVYGSSTKGLAGHFKGSVKIEGDLIVGGAKSAAVRHPDGSHRQLYCMESPESWFEDFGEARLKHGKVDVRLERGFASLVKTKDYHVFLTPCGDCKGMFVLKRHATGFRVCEQQGGTSNVRFAYRVVAKRKDVVAKRLAIVKQVASGKRRLPNLRLRISSPDLKRLSVNPLDLQATAKRKRTPGGRRISTN